MNNLKNHQANIQHFPRQSARHLHDTLQITEYQTFLLNCQSLPSQISLNIYANCQAETKKSPLD